MAEGFKGMPQDELPYPELMRGVSLHVLDLLLASIERQAEVIKMQVLVLH